MPVFEVVSGGDRRSLIKRFERKSKHDAVSELVDIHLAHCTRIEKLEAEAQALREEVAALRARVVAVPKRIEHGVTLGRNGNYVTHKSLYAEGWNACLDELARLNGKAVSEGLLRGLSNFSSEIIRAALEGGNFDGAEVQEIAERHGVIAKQVMNEPCCGPEEHCACAWATSFPTECYRIKPELHALLDGEPT